MLLRARLRQFHAAGICQFVDAPLQSLPPKLIVFAAEVRLYRQKTAPRAFQVNFRSIFNAAILLVFHKNLRVALNSWQSLRSKPRAGRAER
jgi:hypothetical protein